MPPSFQPIMASLGIELRSEREKRDLSLSQIALETRISLKYLECLEAGQYAELPGGMYNRAFLRAYCDYLGLDSTKFLERYEAEIAPPSDKSAKSKVRVPLTGSALRPHPVAVWSLMLVASTGGLYFSRRWIAAALSPYFSHAPAATVKVEPASRPQAAPSSETIATPNAPAASPGTNPVTEPLPLAQSAPPPPAEPRPATEADVVADPSALSKKIQLRCQVLEKCWMSVNSDGDRVLVKILEPGDDQFFEAAERIYLVLGNAAGVRLEINGRKAKPLGKPGEVVKVLINEQSIPDLLEKDTG